MMEWNSKFEKKLDELRQLYNLLQSSQQQHYNMDKGAQLLFKNLLDSATDNIITTRLKAVPPPDKKKRCRICRQPSIRRQNSTNRMCLVNGHQDNVGYGWSDQMGKNYPAELPTDFSKQVSNSIKMIESLQLFTSSMSMDDNPIMRPTQSYVHGLRIPLASQNSQSEKSIGKLAEIESSTAHSHNKNVKPTLFLDNDSPSLPNKRMYVGVNVNHPTYYHDQESDGSEISACSSSYSFSSQPEPESSSTNSSDLSESRVQNVTPGTSSEESRSSASYKDVVDASPPHSRMYQRSRHDNPIGRLRRFKNKLGLIFHHQHHHHHHHHHHHKSIWNHLKQIFHHKKKQQAVGKMKRSSAASKNQVGQFQALVQGMMRHVKHSKKPKVSKAGIRRRSQNSWKMFQPRRGVKLPNKGRVKLQFMNQKPQLATKKIT